MAQTFPMMPLSGIDNRSDDAALRSPGNDNRLRTALREANNVDITQDGRVRLRPGWRRVTATPYRDLWPHPLGGLLFGRLGDAWVRIDDLAASIHTVLAEAGPGPYGHVLLNDRVVLAAPLGCWEHGAQGAQRLGMARPAGPYVEAVPGSLPAGRYGACVSWVRRGQESGTSEVVFTDLSAGGLRVTPPLCLEDGVDRVRVYLTTHNGGELLLAAELAPGASEDFTAGPPAGRPPPFMVQWQMPGGRYPTLWRGRLVVVQANRLLFSEPLAYHVHDPVRGHVLLPQGVTFLVAVETGLWVGQRDHVLFLSGSRPGELAVSARCIGAPVPGSAVLAELGQMPDELGNRTAALWLSEFGYVAGSADGEANPVQKSCLAGISASRGSTVVTGQRAYTAVE
jgi:hypothetical protein